MGLLDMLFGEVDEQEPAPERPAPVSVEEVAGGVYATCTGELLAMEDIPDRIFAAGVMGTAIGIKPSEGVIYAPVDGVVTLTTGTLHALGLATDDGMQILIHAGVDTVNMKGEGFYGFVRKGQRVSAGEPLMTMDLDKIAEAGYSDVAITVITNSDDYAEVIPAAAGQVGAGSCVMVATR